MRTRLLVLPVLLVITCFSLPGLAQTKKSASHPANVQTGTLASIDTAAATLTLKPKTGADIPYRLTEKTRILKGKKSVEADTFKAGDAVVVRFRKSSVGPASLYDLADKTSWEWLAKLRKETTLVTVKEISEDALHATEGADAAAVEYRITEKTACSKGGKPATTADFKPGSKVYVVPRMLPSGGIMAVAISETSESAAKLKERARSTLSGTVKAISAEKKTLSIRSVSGDDRDLNIAADVIVRHLSKDVPLTAVKPGQTVSLRLTRNEENEQVISKITIQSRKTIVKKLPAPKPKTETITPKKPAVMDK